MLPGRICRFVMKCIVLNVLHTFDVGTDNMRKSVGQTKCCEKCRKIPIIFGKIVKHSAHSQKICYNFAIKFNL